jgi:hypothetical protein
MTNLVLNSNFSSPTILTDSYVYYDSLSSTEQAALYWNTNTGNDIALLNGNNAFGYPDPSNNSFNSSQYISIQSVANLNQTITIPKPGFYGISFYYTGRPGYDWNQLQVFLYPSSFNDTLDNSLVTYEWTFYSNTIYVDTSGNYDLIFQAIGVIGVDVCIAISLVDITYVEIEPSPNPTPATIYNTILNGNFDSPKISTTATAKLTSSFYGSYILTSWNFFKSVIHLGSQAQYGNFQYKYPNTSRRRVLILPFSSLSQSIIFTAANDYILTFYTCRSTKGGNITNGCNVNFNGSLLKNLLLKIHQFLPLLGLNIHFH